MDEREARKHCLQPLDGRLATVREAVIDDPEDTPGIVVGRAGHDLFYQAMEGIDARGRFAGAKDARMVNVESGHIGPGAAALVFMLDTHWLFRSSRMCWVLAAARLNAGLFVGRDDKFIGPEDWPFQLRAYRSRIRLALTAKAGSRGEDPAAVIQGADRVLMQPTPSGASGDRCHH